jgi:hypothetical protein
VAQPRSRRGTSSSLGGGRRLRLLPLTWCGPVACWLQLLDVFVCVEELHAMDLHRMLSLERGEYR